MSGLILCRDKTVTHPYYVKELGLHLYTGEELCYFIYHNILLIGEEFLDEPLQRDDSTLISAQLVGDTVVCNGTIYDVIVVDWLLTVLVAVLQNE